jgi:hypothetical protein
VYEDRYQRYTERRGEMQKPGINADDKCGARDLPRNGVEWLSLTDEHTRMTSGDTLSSLTFGIISPRQD